MIDSHFRKVRSFVRRPGRMTSAQRRALTELMPRWGIAFRDRPIDVGELFGRDVPRVLDIGFGDGEALLTLAVNNPSIDYLGVEVHEPGIGHLLLLLERGGLTNVRVIRHDAVEVLGCMLPDEQFDAVNLFFPDPWPKKRHHKRRLVQPVFAGCVARVLRPHGIFHVATDWTDYARHVGAVLKDSGKFTPSMEPDGSSPLCQRPPTKFERRGRQLGHDVTDLYFRRE
jgi:tRNA (guanine-N7-)-methyltransferase